MEKNENKDILEEVIESCQMALKETEDAILMVQGIFERKSSDRDLRAISRMMNALKREKRRIEVLLVDAKEELESLGGQDESSFD